MIFIQHLAIGVIVILIAKRSTAPTLATVDELKSVAYPTNDSTKKVIMKCGWRPKCSKQEEIWKALALLHGLNNTTIKDRQRDNKKKDKESRSNSHRSRQSKSWTWKALLKNRRYATIKLMIS